MFHPYDLITSQRCHLLIPSPKGAAFNTGTWRGVNILQQDRDTRSLREKLCFGIKGTVPVKKW